MTTDKSSRTEKTWRELADSYEVARTRPDSLDALIEFPAQLSLLGDVRDKRILDLACGSGAKALHLATQGAREVIGVDISQTFIDELDRQELPGNVRFIRGDLARLAEIEGVSGGFDAVLLLNALSYVDDELAALSAIRRVLRDEGMLIVARAHPFRFAIKRAELTGVELGAAYRNRGDFPYRSEWDCDVTVTHRTPRVEEMLNALIDAGFSIDRVLEPDLTEAQRAAYPHKATWLDRYVGSLLIRALPRHQPEL